MIFKTATRWTEARTPFGEVVVPLLVQLHDRLEGQDRDASIRIVESWVVRRKLARCNTGGDKQLLRRLAEEIRKAHVDEAVGRLKSELPESSWPSDQQLRCELVQRDMRRHKDLARMALEAIEIKLRLANQPDEDGESKKNVDPPTNMEIEHLMPIRWFNRQNDWPLPGRPNQEKEESETRRKAIWTLGNLTLTTPQLNRDLDTRSWPCKRRKLRNHGGKNGGWNLCLNRHLLKHFGECERWDETAIQTRGCQLAKIACRIWRVPSFATSP